MESRTIRIFIGALHLLIRAVYYRHVFNRLIAKGAIIVKVVAAYSGGLDFGDRQVSKKRITLKDRFCAIAGQKKKRSDWRRKSSDRASKCYRRPD